jgi:hypothetical protein
MAIELISAGLGAALSLFGESRRVEEEKRRLRAQRRALEEAKITPDEQEAILSGINRQFNTRDLGEFNRSAYGLSGVLNADVVRGLNASKLLGERVSTLEDTKNTIRERNKEIQSQIAITYGDSPSINIGNVAAGGILGYQIGESIDKLKKPAEEVIDIPEPVDAGLQIMGFNLGEGLDYFRKERNRGINSMISLR